MIRRRPRGTSRRPIDTKGDPVTESASPLPRPDSPEPTVAGAGLDVTSGMDGIDPEDTEVVPATLTGMVTSARTTYRVMRANACYPAIMAVAAVEDTVAALARISSDLELYAGDCSDQGGKAVVRAGELLGQARSALSDARHHLALDDTDQLDLEQPDVAALTG
jgi:hypothetical protein